MKKSEIRVGATYRGKSGDERWVLDSFEFGGRVYVTYSHEYDDSVERTCLIQSLADWAIEEVKVTP